MIIYYEKSCCVYKSILLMAKKSPFGLLSFKNWSPKVSFRRLLNFSHKRLYPVIASIISKSSLNTSEMDPTST